MIIIGLTGSVGMGKSTTAALFARRGCPVHNSDEAVHRLYKSTAAPLIEAAFPGSTDAEGVDRVKLGAMVFNNPEAMKRLEEIIHPLVREEEQGLREKAFAAGARCLVLDIPLLFETGAEKRCDLVAVVSAPEDVQQARVLARPNMTEERFCAIVSRQLPDAEKRRRAHMVIPTGFGLEMAARAVDDLLRALS